MQEIIKALQEIPAGDDRSVVVENDAIQVVDDVTGAVVNNREARIVRRNGRLEIQVFQDGKLLSISAIKTYGAYDTAQSILNMLMEPDDAV